MPDGSKNSWCTLAYIWTKYWRVACVNIIYKSRDTQMKQKHQKGNLEVCKQSFCSSGLWIYIYIWRKFVECEITLKLICLRDVQFMTCWRLFYTVHDFLVSHTSKKSAIRMRLLQCYLHYQLSHQVTLMMVVILMIEPSNGLNNVISVIMPWPLHVCYFADNVTSQC